MTDDREGRDMTDLEQVKAKLAATERLLAEAMRIMTDEQLLRLKRAAERNGQ